MSKVAKTNAMRLLDSKKVAYEVFEYDISDELLDGISVCHKIGVEPHMMFKTLVTVGKQYGVAVFVVGVDKELDLKKAAEVCMEKKIEMLAVKELLNTVGYLKGGCSPIGMKKKFPVYIDKTCEELEVMYVNGGKRGMTLKLNPFDLLEVVEGKVVDVKKDLE
ncbi:MAG: Cys-tRNA(Pro) deacylase [Flavobacteriaceae bacterium]|jgi:Cys-tRNA(Pro)/Cys-tRNA(Cys) deacylase|nr:Cys-tRNA(Pro) deacylase [Flavobacteriaceae bacterium]